MVKFSLGSSNDVTRTAELLEQSCFYVDVTSQISLLSSPVCRRGFTCEAFCTGQIHTRGGGRGEGGSPIVNVPGDVPPARVYFSNFLV